MSAYPIPPSLTHKIAQNVPRKAAVRLGLFYMVVEILRMLEIL